MRNECSALVQSLQAEIRADARPQRIDAILDELRSAKCGVDVIGPLLQSLDDRAEYQEEMFSIIHAAEAFPLADYVREVLAAIVSVKAAAPDWASVVLMRLLNSDDARALLVRQVRAASPAIKQAVHSLCEEINAVSPEFLQKTVAVMISST